MNYPAVTHTDWHNQRYGSTYKATETQAVAQQTKLDEYAAINEYNKAKKANNLSSAELIFSEHGIPFEVRGHAWLVNVAGHEYYYYPKSNKYKPKGGSTTYYSRSAADFLGKVAAYLLRNR